MENIVLRKAEINDLEALKQLFFETVSTICSADYDALQIKVWSDGIKNENRWNAIIMNQVVIIAQQNEKIVGFITLDNNSIDLLYVHKDHQRLGVAFELYKTIEQFAKQQGQKELESDVSITAKPFFEKMGFEIVNEQTVLLQGIELSNFKMAKQLV